MVVVGVKGWENVIPCAGETRIGQGADDAWYRVCWLAAAAVREREARARLPAGRAGSRGSPLSDELDVITVTV